MLYVYISDPCLNVLECNHTEFPGNKKYICETKVYVFFTHLMLTNAVVLFILEHNPLLSNKKCKYFYIP